MENRKDIRRRILDKNDFLSGLRPWKPWLRILLLGDHLKEKKLYAEKALENLPKTF